MARVVPPVMAGIEWVSSLAEPWISLGIVRGNDETSDTVMGAVGTGDGASCRLSLRSSHRMFSQLR